MRRIIVFAILAWPLLGFAFARANEGTISYRARVVHNSRRQMSVVEGIVFPDSGNFFEEVQESYFLEWKQFPGRLTPVRPALPSIWRVEKQTAQQLINSLPRFNSPLLRHFVVGHVIADVEQIQSGSSYLAGQLIVDSVDTSATSFELVCTFRGYPLVVVGRRQPDEDRHLVKDLAVLGTTSELYQYFFDEIEYSSDPAQPTPQLPDFDPKEYVTFPSGNSSVAIRPVKDWLVFKASLPNGRPLNLVFDSGAETMLIDDLVLKVDLLLEPVGKLPVAGAYETEEMHLYEGFGFDIGGVQFRNLPVIGTQLTRLGFGADMRIHGVVGNEILQLCRLDLDLANGLMHLSPADSSEQPIGDQLALTFIEDLPHVGAQVEDTGEALLMLDTGQRTPLSVNLDWLDRHEMGDELVMNGFLGGVAGGLMPRYILENLSLSLAGHTCQQPLVDAGMESTYSYDGVPVVGVIGFPLLARHFGGITFDYSHKMLYLRDPGDDHVFAGRPEAWESKPATPYSRRTEETPPSSLDPRRPVLKSTGDTTNDPRAGYQWSDAQLNVADPLSLIRATAPPQAPAVALTAEEMLALEASQHEDQIEPSDETEIEPSDETENEPGDQPPSWMDDLAAGLVDYIAEHAHEYWQLTITEPVEDTTEPVEDTQEDEEPESEPNNDEFPFTRGLPRLRFKSPPRSG